MEFCDVTKKFQDWQGSVTTISAVEGVSLPVSDGEVVSLIGMSGCGKSTLLKMASGLSDKNWRNGSRRQFRSRISDRADLRRCRNGKGTRCDLCYNTDWDPSPLRGDPYR
ncbi:MAG TPA: hypothetical protein DEV64_04195 [Rhodospirillaceae bacterium]|nr:hypothetical protein [Rhodospirillaceae bacterium]